GSYPHPRRRTHRVARLCPRRGRVLRLAVPGRQRGRAPRPTRAPLTARGAPRDHRHRLEPRVTDLDRVISTLPADDPAPGVEVDVTASGVDVRRAAGQRDVKLADDESAALRAGLEVLAGSGDEGAAALLSRWPETNAPAA